MVEIYNTVPPGSVSWSDFFQATDPASNPDNGVGPGMSWDEADDDVAPTVILNTWRRSLDNTTWILKAVGGGGSGGDAATLQTHPAADFVLDSEKGAALGVAELDAGGKVPSAQLPAIAITDAFVVASQAAMLALTAEKGDVAIRSDLNKSFILSTNSPGTLADWKELLTPTDTVLSVNGATGAVTLVVPTAGEKAALAGTDGTPGAGNPYVTDSDSRLTGVQVVDDAGDLDDTLGFAGAVVIAGEVLPMFWDAANSEWVSPAMELQVGGLFTSTATADQTTYDLPAARIALIKQWADAGLTAQIRLRAALKNADGGTTTTLNLDLYYYDAGGVSIETVVPTGLANVGTEKIVQGAWQDIPAGSGAPPFMWPWFWLKTSNGSNLATARAHSLELRFRKT